MFARNACATWLGPDRQLMISALTIGLFILFVLVNIPVSAAIGLATIIGLLAGGYDLMTLPQHMAASVKSIELMAIPFFILAAALMLLIRGMVRVGWVQTPAPTPFDWGRLWRTTRKTILALLAPIVIIWGMLSGWVTPTEAGIMAVFYALFVGAVYRTLTWRGLIDSLEA